MRRKAMDRSSDAFNVKRRQVKKEGLKEIILGLRTNTRVDLALVKSVGIM